MYIIMFIMATILVLVVLNGCKKKKESFETKSFRQTFYGTEGDNIVYEKSGDINIMTLTKSDGSTEEFKLNSSDLYVSVFNNVAQPYLSTNTIVVYGADGTKKTYTAYKVGDDLNQIDESDPNGIQNVHDHNGIPKSQIPPGDEDLYVLKSSIVQTICPKCPEPIKTKETSDVNLSCPPCPPCQRCPATTRPTFQDALSMGSINPSYFPTNDPQLPYPILSQFSTFGM